ncbi:sugar transferase [Sutcliffiella horikoshii]|uniref:sugar transferase n=1 Tax=Sutcliffiella horikoshii TaxID=79883 RepID=UPI00384D0FB1
MKRYFDLIASITLVVVLAPLFIGTSIFVKLDVGSPILFRQSRIGLNEKPFTIYKFRTMSDKKGVNGELLPDVERISLLGKLLRKFSLDELPQLFNVIKGDLSLVGPRPLLPEYLPLYNEEQKRRHHVKPGITGFAQVNGRNSISWEEKFQLDTWYVDNQSFLLDIKILVITIIKTAFPKGINNNQTMTMPLFKGEKHNG